MKDVLHYRGNQTLFDASHVMGPDMFGARYRVLAAAYDPETDVTELAVVPITPDALKQRMADSLPEIIATARIEQLFGTGAQA